MIKTKYVIGDVVIVDGKQQVIFLVYPVTFSPLYEDGDAMYKLNNGKWYFEDQLDADSIN